MKHQVLVVDDDPILTGMLKDCLSREPYKTLCAESAEEALKIMADEHVDVVVSDEVMPGMSGSEFLSVVRKKYPDTIRMILTGHASVESAIRAINDGEIYRFFTKPCNLFELAITIRQSLQQRELMKQSRKLLRMAKHQYAFIERLENLYPGVTKVRRDAGGSVLMSEEIDLGDWDTLKEQIVQTVRKCEAFFRERGKA